MPDITIPDAAVEAAAHSMFEVTGVTGEPDWTEMEIRQVVEAAAPYIAAQALRDFADGMTSGFNKETLNAERRAIKREARACADRIEAETNIEEGVA